MSFDLGKSVNDTAEWLTSSSVIYTLTSNTIYMAVLLTIALVFIISYINETKSKYKYTKMALYIFFANSILLFIHHYALTNRIKKSFSVQQTEDIQQQFQIGDDTISPKLITGGAPPDNPNDDAEQFASEIRTLQKETDTDDIDKLLAKNTEIVNKIAGSTIPQVIKV
jgi:hypothetical protein